MFKKVCFYIVLVSALLVSSCGMEVETPLVNDRSSIAEYSGKPQGELTLNLDNGARLYIPSGAVGETNIRFERLETMPQDLPTLPQDAVTLGPFYDINAISGELKYPATITLPYDPEPLEKLGISGDAVGNGMYLAFPKGKDWKRVYGIVDQQDHTFTAMFSELDDPILMWDFYDTTEPFIGLPKIKYSGDWYSTNIPPSFKFYMYNGAVQIDQPVTLGLTYEWSGLFEDCARQMDMDAGNANRWEVLPILVLRDGRRLLFNVDHESQDLTQTNAVWMPPTLINSKPVEVQLDLGVMPVTVSPEEILGMGFYLSLWGLKYDKNECGDSNSAIEEKYFEVPLIYTVSELPSATGTTTPVPTPTFTPVADSGSGIGLANPASKYCLEQGNKLEMRMDSSGNMYGVCIFPNGNECEEWAYYNGTCGPEGGMSNAQSYVGAYVVGQYTRSQNSPESDTISVTVKRIEKVIEAIDDHTIRVEVSYQGDGKELISTQTYTYTVDLLTGEIIADSSSGFSNPLSLGTLIKSGLDGLDYAISYDEVIDDWTFKWKGMLRRDPDTYLLLMMERMGEVYDPNGAHWGNYVDLIELVEIKIP